MELLLHFEHELLGDPMVSQKETVSALLEKLHNQVIEQELFSNAIRTRLQNVKAAVYGSNSESAVEALGELLKTLRPLHIQELKRLVEKTKEAAELIRGKEIVLLIGGTGAGKSTTIQFLAGCEMKEVPVEVAPGRFLDHITAVKVPNYPGLKDVISNPECQSETRYITPVTIPLKDILGPGETGNIILCDAPGFGDTAGSEVDIANGVGIIEALKGCKSVKILALSSFKALGDRAQGIQELAHILIKMIANIEDRLDTMNYAFTKYPSTTDIHAYILNIKEKVVDKDHSLRSDISFVAVLKDMIEKTQNKVEKIDPIHGNRKLFIRTLQRGEGITCPEEAFRFSMNLDTQKTVASEAQRYEMSIRCAAKHKNIDLVKYYLDTLKVLKDLTKEGFVKDAYEKSVRFMSDNIEEFCSVAKEKFNRAFESLDGLREGDVQEYKIFVEYIQVIQKPLGGHLESGLVSPTALIQNIHTEIQKRRHDLGEQHLSSSSVEIYLGNLKMLKRSFPELELEYRKNCKDFEERFDELVKSADEPILANEFSQAAEIILEIYKSSNVLKDHLSEKVEDRYRDTFVQLLRHLKSVSEKAEPILDKVRLNDNDVKTLNEYIDILRSAKETSALQERFSTYAETLKIGTGTSPNNFKNLNEIYSDFIEKIVKYFDQINIRIKELFEKNGNYALEQIEKLVSDMDTIRKIPEIEWKTSGTYYRTVDNVRGYMQQLQKDAEHLLIDIDKKSGSINYSHLARSLSRLKYAEWINRVSPGAYETLMRRITEELIENAQKLEEQLKRLDFHLRHPNNVALAQDIIEKVESMRILERSVPDLEKYRVRILDWFRETTQEAFDSIQKTFNLQDRDVYTLKQQLKELENIRNEYDSLHPAQKYLQEQEYPNIDQLNSEIEDVTEKLKKENDRKEAMKLEQEEKAKKLQDIIGQFFSLSEKGSDQNMAAKVIKKVKMTMQKGNSEIDNYLNEHGYSTIDDVYEAKVNTTKEYHKKLQLIQESCKALSDTLNRLEKIRRKYKSLLLVRSDSVSSEGTKYLHEKKQNNIESLNAKIEEKKKIISEREKNKQTYDFSGRFDGSIANNALLYVIQCEKVGDTQVKRTAIETNGILQKYIIEYGNFLNQEIARLYQNAQNSEVEGGPLQYAHELNVRLEELSSLKIFPEVFDCVKGVETIAHWQGKVTDCYVTLNRTMEQHHSRGESENLRKQLVVVHALSCLDQIRGDTRFCDLYIKYQSGINQDLREAYKIILSAISVCGYAAAGMTLSDIDDQPLNQKAEKQIVHDLQSSLVKLMKDTKCKVHWLYGKIERGTINDTPIEEIVANIEKIRTALNQCNLMDLLDGITKRDLENFQDEIDKMLSDIILKGFASIETYMNNDNFTEAEEGMDNIGAAHRALTGSIASQEVINKTKEFREKLDTVAKDLTIQTDFSIVDKYFERPPKDLLAKLKQVSERRHQYRPAYTTLSERLRLTFSKAIEEAGKVPMKERSEKLRSLNYALGFVPDELQGQFEKHIGQMEKTIRIEEERYERELDNSLKVADDNDHTIIKIGELAKQFQEKEMNEFSEKMNEEILKRLHLHRINLQSSLDENDMQSALGIMDKIIKFKASVAHYIPGIKEIHDTTRKSTTERFERCSKILAEISKIEKPEIGEKALSNTIACVDFSRKQGTTDGEFLPETAIQNCTKDLKIMQEYFEENSKNYKDALKEMAVDNLHTVMNISKKWEKLLDTVNSMKDGATKSLIPDVRDVVTHTAMVSDVSKEIKSLKTQLDVELISDETTKFETKREEFFSQLKKSISKLKEIDAKLQDILPTPVNAKESEENLIVKARKIGKQLLDTTSKPELNQVDFNHFRKYYEHLIAFDKHLSLPNVEIQSTVDTSKAQVFEKVTSFCKEFANAGKDLGKAAEMLVIVKSFAENLSMFDSQINTDIDEALKKSKEKHGAKYITDLSMRLQTTDIGQRVMSEHSLLKGEDWRKRNAKMQKQDDLDYILERLEGDDLDKDMLKRRFRTFKKKYDDLLLSNLLSCDQATQKDSLNTLISNTICFADKVAPNSTSLSLNQTFKDKIPELLAYIFVIWTLQNTEYYNEIRGIESSEAYLLKPHVAQVISIFRILGIGYQTSGSSKNLFNNLVQVGTGEGKSVIMAAIACIFALIGVDVNCSCYSDSLSTRDKEAFASLFGALRIQEHIEYGTFNKLCENLLNEHCDVREKVRDMILKNKSALEIMAKTKRIRPKVLLIDEVDVFLSDEYYGGIYTPVVYLKHPVIKTLLDTIWTNRSIRTLNGIKSMPAYATCASHFSNWTFLLDEGIKDMIASLQSFQSSTYLVQNDRIVYVEGESIAENVVRGYDTIWAYYHENKNGKISSSSLEANVGIIVNCGAFSYAEMPHDFAYITGVTGTLKTLATAEKEILGRVYEVKKSTYTPSVFGECRLNYNCASDVRAVKETEYFMEIRGEIDVFCRAKRAILVFFQSEDKLMKFYHSSELSSIKESVQIITEKVSVKNRELYIKHAATIGKVTLLTRTFGRGTDFICNNQQLLASGGLHVLQTFFSEELSEEYQIKGRGARQGDSGSYRMILLDKDLEWVLGASYATKLPTILGSTLYAELNTARSAIFESKCNSKEVGIEQRKGGHNASKNFITGLKTGNIAAVKEFLQNQNIGANLVKASSRTVLLMDATGSMSSLLSAAKETVCTMFERAASILSEKGLPNDAFQMQFVVYRDYDCKSEKILQSSSWETKPISLRNFMTPIAAMGGGDYEDAIEIGLWYAVQESKQPDGISQVILIGDAPAKERPAIARDRNATGGEVYWSKTKYKIPTYYMDELQKLKAKNIPVHTFYLEDGAKNNFQIIAKETSGRCEHLNINSTGGAESLTHFVTEEILRMTAGDQGHAVVELYRKKYVKGFTG
ncbi:unnamed protein product [Rotaria magnacalcarata]|nr:unnamed protein product [Rotaria magnacalcarata]